MDDFGAKKHLVLRMALEWHISVHVSHYFYPFSGSICLTAPCSFILTFAPLKFSSVPSPNSSIAALHVSLNFAFPSRVFTAHKKFHSHSSFFRSHSLPLPLSPLSVCPSLFHVHAHLSSGVSCCPVGFFGGRQVERRIRDEETDRERGTGERERGQRGRVWQKVRERGGEREWNTSNSQRQAAFPWQRGFHRNSPAKDAISEEQKEKCHSPLIWRAHTHTRIHTNIPVTYMRLYVLLLH